MRVYSTRQIDDLSKHISDYHFSQDNESYSKMWNPNEETGLKSVSCFYVDYVHTDYVHTWSVLRAVSDQLIKKLKEYKKYGHVIPHVNVSPNSPILKQSPYSSHPYYSAAPLIRHGSCSSIPNSNEIVSSKCLDSTAHFPTFKMYTDMIIMSTLNDMVWFESGFFCVFRHIFDELRRRHGLPNFLRILRTISSNPHMTL